ncbi:MAG: 50S ribosomal protein L11 methyltransferase [Candidatus Korarchaeota archaeon]
MKGWKKAAQFLEHIPEAINFIPRGWNEYGDAIVIKLSSEGWKYANVIGEALLKATRKKSIFAQRSINGITRKPDLVLIAGEDIEKVYFEELGARFVMPIKEVMFSRGNHGEKVRLIKLVREGECIVDLFACIGQWSIVLGVNTKAKRIDAIDINPTAVEYLRENIELNKLQSKVFAHLGDCREVAPKDAADRVIAGVIFEPEKFIETEVSTIRKRGIIHYHYLSKTPNNDEIKKIFSQYATVYSIESHLVKSYAPSVFHYVADVEVEK